MLWPQYPLLDAQGLLVERERLLVAPQVNVAIGQIVAAGEGVRMLRPLHSLPDAQGLLVERERLLVAPQFVVASGQVVTAG